MYLIELQIAVGRKKMMRDISEKLQIHPLDIVILSNGPGEVTTWVRPVVQSLRQQFGEDREQLRISVILSPCSNATGKEGAIARSYPQVDRVQEAQSFFPFLLWGKTQNNWDWRNHGVVVFLGGDQIFPVVIGKRLGYATVIYGEWEVRWYRWVNRFGVMNAAVAAQVPPKYQSKVRVVGDLMADVSQKRRDITFLSKQSVHQVGLLPGSKAMKLQLGVPLMCTIAEHVAHHCPETRFVLPVAPTLDLSTLARFGNPQSNPAMTLFTSGSIILEGSGQKWFLKTSSGVKIDLVTQFPAYDILSQCSLCLTTVGANTAELGSLGVPMFVLLPTQKLEVMRAWDGIPGLLANLPGVGTVFAKMINSWMLRKKRLYAWPNIWAQQEIVPELMGNLQPEKVAAIVVDYLTHPDKLVAMESRLREVRGESGAADRLVNLVKEVVQDLNPEGDTIDYRKEF